MRSPRDSCSRRRRTPRPGRRTRMASRCTRSTAPGGSSRRSRRRDRDWRRHTPPRPGRVRRHTRPAPVVPGSPNERSASGKQQNVVPLRGRQRIAVSRDRPGKRAVLTPGGRRAGERERAAGRIDGAGEEHLRRHGIPHDQRARLVEIDGPGGGKAAGIEEPPTGHIHGRRYRIPATACHTASNASTRPSFPMTAPLRSWLFSGSFDGKGKVRGPGRERCRPGRYDAPPGVAMPTQLDHIILRVNDRAPSIEFYTSILGLRVRGGARALLRHPGDARPHAPARAVGDPRRRPSRAFAMRARNSTTCFAGSSTRSSRMVMRSTQWGTCGGRATTGSRGPGKAVYFFDPSKNLIEIRHYETSSD